MRQFINESGQPNDREDRTRNDTEQSSDDDDDGDEVEQEDVQVTVPSKQLNRFKSYIKQYRGEIREFKERIKNLSDEIKSKNLQDNVPEKTQVELKGLESDIELY